jgi:hypothetical protein
LSSVSNLAVAQMPTIVTKVISPMTYNDASTGAKAAVAKTDPEHGAVKIYSERHGQSKPFDAARRHLRRSYYFKLNV